MLIYVVLGPKLFCYFRLPLDFNAVANSMIAEQLFVLFFGASKDLGARCPRYLMVSVFSDIPLFI